MSSNPVELDLDRIGDITPDSIEREYDIGLSNTVYINQVSPSYHRLQQAEVQSIKDKLEARFGTGAVVEVEVLLRNLKNASCEPSTSQTYEWLVQKALGAPGIIRGGGSSIQEMPEHSVETFREHYRISQAFLRREFSRTIPLYRGLYPEEFVPLVKAILDNPYSSSFLLHSPVVTSYTLSKDVANNFSKGVRIQWQLQDDAIAFAADCLRKPPQSIKPEGEMHVLSGSLLLNAERFMMTLSEEYPLVDVIRRMATPEDLPQQIHSDLLRLFEMFVDYEVQSESKQATNRLWLWYRYCKREKELSDDQLELAKAVVTHISGEHDWRPDNDLQ
jgi:hypothetical protein